MKRGRKRLLVAGLVLALMLLAAGTAIWCYIPSAGPPQFVTLPDGTKYRFAGATWGTSQVPPFLAERLVYHLPERVSDWVQKKFGAKLGLLPASPVDTPQLQVWLNLVSHPASHSSALPLRAVLADEDGVEAGTPFGNLSGYESWPQAAFPLVPRRSRMLEVHFYPYPNASGAQTTPTLPKLGSARFRNPLYGRYPQWQPELLPVSKKVGEVQVTLANTWVGSEWNGILVTHFDLELEQPPATHEHWAVQQIEMSDATGNRILTDLHMQDGGWEASVRALFWPDEKAIRLKVWLKRTAGFASNEVVAITNLPLPKANATNGVTFTNLVGGHKLLVWNFKKIVPEKRGLLTMYTVYGGPALGPHEIAMVLPDHPVDVLAEWVKISTDTGEEFNDYGSHTTVNGQSRLFETMPVDARYLNATISVQKMRTVEFLVRPPNAK